MVGTIDGAVGPATKDYVRRVINEAGDEYAACVVLLIDTPGGLSASMRDIIQDIFASTVPVVVYVSPSGARAASAGALIALAAHVAAMAPGTNIGAAHPVSIGGGSGETDETMEEKVTNDAAAYARSIADKRGRSVEWAEKVVRESVSSTAQEALDEGVIDVIAEDLAGLLEKIDGMEVDTAAGTRTIRTGSAEVVNLELSFREKFLARISDPNIAYLLMLLGIFGIFFELQNPGAIFPGVVGVIAIVLATFALQLLPVSYAGLGLIVLAIIFFALETQIASGGLLTVGGAVSMLIGSIMLIDSPLPFMRVSLSVIIPSVIFTVLFFLFAVGLGLRAQKRKVSTGDKGLVGERGVAKTDVSDGGSVFVHGEYWNAYSAEKIPAASDVEVVEVDGMKLKVRMVGSKEVS
jgi:membrane-bound serine protease (ClpP class)